MTLKEAIAIVRRFNLWRRGEIPEEMLPPVLIGQALDALCDHAERMEREATAAKFASTTAEDHAT